MICSKKLMLYTVAACLVAPVAVASPSLECKSLTDKLAGIEKRMQATRDGRAKQALQRNLAQVKIQLVKKRCNANTIPVTGRPTPVSAVRPSVQPRPQVQNSKCSATDMRQLHKASQACKSNKKHFDKYRQEIKSDMHKGLEAAKRILDEKGPEQPRYSRLIRSLDSTQKELRANFSKINKTKCLEFKRLSEKCGISMLKRK
jgi:hypothetical protein